MATCKKCNDQQEIPCPRCNGGTTSSSCLTCKGKGWREGVGTCTDCKGDGSVDPDECQSCHGNESIPCPVCYPDC